MLSVPLQEFRAVVEAERRIIIFNIVTREQLIHFLELNRGQNRRLD